MLLFYHSLTIYYSWMFTQGLASISPDYTVSQWLQFRGCGRVPGDPGTAAQFNSALVCLTTITTYFAEVSGPWCAATAQEVREIHRDYITWCRYTPNAQQTEAFVPITLHCLAALSMRRLFAVSEFGGAQREEYPMFHHLHGVITCAARGAQRSTIAKPKALHVQAWPKQANMPWIEELPNSWSMVT